MTQTPGEPLRDDDIESVDETGSASGAVDADGTDTADADGTDTADADGTDADGTDTADSTGTAF